MDSTGHPLDYYDEIMAKSQLTNRPGGPFGSDESFFNKIGCHMTVYGEGLFSFGGSDRVDFGEQVWVDSYICGM